MTERNRAPSGFSLRNKLLLFAAALVVVPGIVLAVIAVRSGQDSLQRVIGRELAREAGHTADRFSSVLRAERETLSNFARQDLMREIRVADIDKRVSVALKTLRDGSSVRRDYLVADREGFVVAASDPALIGPMPSWLGQAPGTVIGKDRLLGPLRSPGADRASLVMTTSIPDPDDASRVIGTLIGLFDWEALTAVTENVRQDLVGQGIAADVLVSRANGEVIGGAFSSAAEDASHRAGIADAAKDVPDAVPDYTVHAAAGLIVGRASLASDLPDWKLLVVEPRAHALAPARSLSNRLLFTMGLALVAALAVAALSAARVVKPLSELTRAIRSLPRGGDAHRQVPVRSDDEVGELAGAFNQMSSELEQAQHDLVEAEKFAFVGELAAGVAHEIRTSLGVLGSSAQILERSLPKQAESEVGEMAGMIRAEVGRLGGVVNDLLTLDRERPPRVEAGKVSDPVFRAANFVAPQAQEKGIELVQFAAADEPEILCEAELIYQVALNLIANATQVLGKKGRIEVRILKAENGFGGFEVQDDGPGIPEELRERIFQPFVSARQGGVGLGLTYVKRVIHDHRGRVSVRSQPGQGTCFRVELPLAERAA